MTAEYRPGQARRKERVWRTVAEGAASVDGSLVTWRVVEADDGDALTKWVEVGSRKERVFLPVASMAKAVDELWSFLYPEEAAAEAKKAAETEKAKGVKGNVSK